MRSKKKILMVFVVCFALFISFGCLDNDDSKEKPVRTASYTDREIDPSHCSAFGFPRVVQGESVEIELYDVSGGDLHIYIVDQLGHGYMYYEGYNIKNVQKYSTDRTTIPGVGAFIWTVSSDSEQWYAVIYNPGNVKVKYNIRITVDS